MSRSGAFFVVLLLWAALYLPWLGSSDLRSEEGHRVMPAIEMMQSGDYLVPRVAGQLYLCKPPLVNWIVAASFRLSGGWNEWSARLPSALALLALGCFVLIAGRKLLGARGAFAAALACLTSLGLIEKGRMIEIEAIYVTLFAFALLSWLLCWQARKSPWVTWTVPWIFLGLGLLAKGPALLLFFYAAVAAVLWQMRRLRELSHPAHFVGLCLMSGIFLCWAWPYSRAIDGQLISQTWKSEFVMRLNGEESNFIYWLDNFPTALSYFLPFGLFLPFVRCSQMSTAQAPIARGLLYGAIVPSVFVLLLPGAIARYVLPAVVPAACVFGFAIEANAFAWRAVPPRLVWILASVTLLGAMIVFPARSATTLRHRRRFSAQAAVVNARVPVSETLYAIDAGFQPYFLYLHTSIRYLRTLPELPAEARYLVVRRGMAHAVETNLHGHLLARTARYRGQTTLLYVCENR
jgi:4-amino-4-deoxy-L-arabinose transferase-like glycosyltransferase